MNPVVAVINTSLEVIDLLKQVLADEGYRPVAAFVHEFKRGERDLAAFLAEHRPSAVLWDIAIPYVENWEYFQQHALGLLPPDSFVCTSINTTALELLVGPTTSIELIGRPFDLDVILEHVREAVERSNRR